MQNQLPFTVKLFPVELPEDFPLTCFSYTQRYKSYRDLHSHTCAELGLCLEGSGVFFIGNCVYAFRKGDVSYVPAGVPHIAQSADESPSRWWFLSFDPAWFDRGSEGSYCGVFNDEDCTAVIRILRRACERQQPDRETVRLALRLFLRMAENGRGGNEALPGTGESLATASILPAIHFLSQHYAQEVSVSRLAETCSLSESHFRTLFRSATGDSPTVYLARVRMLAAAELLRGTEYPVARIAEDTGYTSLSSFNRQFKSMYGMSPSEYRRLEERQ